ncbi:MAG: aspartate aminotransferase family protein, partial [Sedimentisphaerales bacterium]|nr:aspartate aminotransferase family protein [Sedimentisphaerales bacterium]
MAKEFPLTPVKIQPISTPHRKVSGMLPHPQAVADIEKLRSYEARSMQGQLPIIWDRAEGFNVFDAYGNMWLDFSSGVLITNAGHGRREIADAIIAQASRPLLTTYCFPNQQRIK